MSDVSTHGADLGKSIRDDFWLIATIIEWRQKLRRVVGARARSLNYRDRCKTNDVTNTAVTALCRGCRGGANGRGVGGLPHRSGPTRMLGSGLVSSRRSARYCFQMKPTRQRIIPRSFSSREGPTNRFRAKNFSGHLLTLQPDPSPGRLPPPPYCEIVFVR